MAVVDCIITIITIRCYYHLSLPLVALALVALVALPLVALSLSLPYLVFSGPAAEVLRLSRDEPAPLRPPPSPTLTGFQTLANNNDNNDNCNYSVISFTIIITIIIIISSSSSSSR